VIWALLLVHETSAHAATGRRYAQVGVGRASSDGVAAASLLEDGRHGRGCLARQGRAQVRGRDGACTAWSNASRSETRNHIAGAGVQLSSAQNAPAGGAGL